MKKSIIIAVGAALLVSSCGTYTGTGAYTGSTLGSILGSAIGGISDGPRGSDIGTIVGMVGGAVVGGAIGSAADRQMQVRTQERHERILQRDAQKNAERNYQEGYQDGYEQGKLSNSGVNYQQQGSYDSGFDETNSGDDRIYDFNGSDYTSNYSAQKPTTVMPGKSSVEELSAYSYTPAIEIRNARFVDANKDNVISRGEMCKVIFEVMNRGNQTLYDVQPTVVEATGNKQIYISPGMHVEKIEPGKGIRYTALVKAGDRLRDGNVKICISVLQGDKAISKVNEFNIPTRKK